MFDFATNPIVFPDIISDAARVPGMACGACRPNPFIEQYTYSGPHTITTAALGAKLFCNGVEITSGVTWSITAQQHTFNYLTGAYDLNSLDALGYPYNPSRVPNFINNAFATDNRFGEASCYSDNGAGFFEETGIADLAGGFSINNPSDPNTTFTLSGVYASGLGDWGGYIRVSATFLGVEHVAWVFITAHVVITAIDCTP